VFVGCEWGFEKSIKTAKSDVFCQSYIVGFGTDLSCSGGIWFVVVLSQLSTKFGTRLVGIWCSGGLDIA
jgi:hypothetical protein